MRKLVCKLDLNFHVGSYSLLTDTNNISKPPFRSCSILVPIRYASFRQAVPIFRFVSIFLIKNAGSELSVYPETTSQGSHRAEGRRRRAARHASALDAATDVVVTEQLVMQRSIRKQVAACPTSKPGKADGWWCCKPNIRCVVVVSRRRQPLRIGMGRRAEGRSRGRGKPL